MEFERVNALTTTTKYVPKMSLTEKYTKIDIDMMLTIQFDMTENAGDDKFIIINRKKNKNKKTLFGLLDLVEEIEFVAFIEKKWMKFNAHNLLNFKDNFSDYVSSKFNGSMVSNLLLSNNSSSSDGVKYVRDMIDYEDVKSNKVLVDYLEKEVRMNAKKNLVVHLSNPKSKLTGICTTIFDICCKPNIVKLRDNLLVSNFFNVHTSPPPPPLTATQKYTSATHNYAWFPRTNLDKQLLWSLDAIHNNKKTITMPLFTAIKASGLDSYPCESFIQIIYPERNIRKYRIKYLFEITNILIDEKEKSVDNDFCIVEFFSKDKKEHKQTKLTTTSTSDIVFESKEFLNNHDTYTLVFTSAKSTTFQLKQYTSIRNSSA